MPVSVTSVRRVRRAWTVRVITPHPLTALPANSAGHVIWHALPAGQVSMLSGLGLGNVKLRVVSVRLVRHATNKDCDVSKFSWTRNMASPSALGVHLRAPLQIYTLYRA